MFHHFGFLYLFSIQGFSSGIGLNLAFEKHDLEGSSMSFHKRCFKHFWVINLNTSTAGLDLDFNNVYVRIFLPDSKLILVLTRLLLSNFSITTKNCW